MKCLEKHPARAATFSRKDAAEKHHVCVVLEINGKFFQLTMSHTENISRRVGPYHMSTLWRNLIQKRWVKTSYCLCGIINGTFIQLTMSHLEKFSFKSRGSECLAHSRAKQEKTE
jgi:hypothetical protein